MPVKKRLLIFAWEYDGYHSERGAALARRIRQVAESFNLNNWEVVVIHKDNRNECAESPFLITTEKNGIKRISVRSGKDIDSFHGNLFIRKLETLFYIAFRGDRSYFWGREVIGQFADFGLREKPDYILSFYTPRAPLLLGHYFSKKLGVPWIADIQDPIYQGISNQSKSFAKLWMKNILKTAKSIVHISPEWAEADGREIGRKMTTIRHAVPEDSPKIPSDFDAQFNIRFGDSFNVFYGGSLSPFIQSLTLLNRVVQYALSINIKVRLLIAGNQGAYDLFKQEFGEQVAVHLGWLTPQQMNDYVHCCNCTLAVPWSKERIGVPSKFYELCSYKKPIWIIGNDIGGFASILNEWKHPAIPIDDLEYQKKALISAAAKNDYSLMFDINNSTGKVVRANDIYDEYRAVL